MLLLPIISLYCQILLQLIGGALTLKDVTVTIPQAANIGDTITLQCHYDLEEEPLYTVKWYKGDREFFRYIPKELPSTQVFPYLGMDIDIGKSTPNSVVLRNVQQNMTGRYGCEVSTDAPNFYTIQDKAYMFIVQTPMGEPEVFIEKELYEINYVLRGNCSSPISYPAMNLTWYLNGKKEPESFKTTVPTTDSVGEKRRPASTIIGLETEVDSSTFKSGKMVLRCRAEFFNLYQSYAEVSLEEEKPRPRPSSVLGTRDASSDGRPKNVLDGKQTPEDCGSRLPRALFMISYVILVAIVMR